MQYAFDFLGEPPRRPSKGERLFYAVLLDKEDASRVGAFGRNFLAENLIQSALLPEDRRHISLHHLGDFKRLRSPRVYAAKLAGDRVSMSVFDITLDAIMSFGAMHKPGREPRYPLVLHAEGAGLFELHTKLGDAMGQYGMKALPDFTPHLTLSYANRPIAPRPIQPIRIAVTSFCLIHSLQGLTEYRILKRWSLNETARTLH